MTRKQEIGTRNMAFKYLQMAALSEQDGDREKANYWRKEASGCFRISVGHVLRNQLYIGGTKTGRFRVTTGGKPTKP